MRVVGLFVGKVEDGGFNEAARRALRRLKHGIALKSCPISALTRMS